MHRWKASSITSEYTRQSAIRLRHTWNQNSRLRSLVYVKSRHGHPKLGALVKPATLLKFHKALVDRKYCRLFSSRHRRRKPGPKGPSAALIAAIVELKRRNPKFGCV